MREITIHKVTGVNDKLRVTATETLGPGGAPHTYRIEPESGNATGVTLDFQLGPLGEHPNGLTHEAILAVVIDRLEMFQKGPYACRENEIALDNIKDGLTWLQERTLNRAARGVEGTMKK